MSKPFYEEMYRRMVYGFTTQAYMEGVRRALLRETFFKPHSTGLNAVRGVGKW